MHSTYSFLLNYENIDDPELDPTEIKEMWLREQAALMLFKVDDAEKNRLQPEDLAAYSKRFEDGLEERWIKLSTQEKEDAVKDQIEKAKFQLITKQVEIILEQEYLSPFTDENNWYQSEVAVFKNGVVVSLCDLDDWRGRGYTYYQYLLMDRNRRWDKSFSDCLRICAHDFNVPGLSQISIGQPPTEMDEKIHYMTAEELIKNIEEYAPRYMSQELLKYVGTVLSRARGNKADINIADILNLIYPANSGFNFDTNPDVTKTINSLALIKNDKIEDGWMADYQLKQALQAYQSWYSAIAVPFSTDYNNPYHNYRCYDLRAYDDRHELIQDNSVIIEVDIHT